MKRRLFLGGLGLLLLLLLGAGILVWALLNTRWGLDRSIELANRYAPVEIEAQRTTGSLAGGSTFEGLSIRGDGWRLMLDRAQLDWSPTALMDRIVKVESLDAGSARLVLEPSEPSTESGIDLPPLDFGWDILIDQARVDQLTVQTRNEPPTQIDDIALDARLVGGKLQIETALAAVQDYRASVQGMVDSTNGYFHDLELTVSEAGKPLLLASAHGNADRTTLTLDSRQYNADGTLVLTDWTRELGWTADLDVAQWESLHELELDATGTLTTASGIVRGRYDQIPFKATIADADFAEGIRATIDPLVLPDQHLTAELQLSSDDFQDFEAAADFAWDPPDRTIVGHVTASGTPEAYELQASGQIDQEVGWSLTATGDPTAVDPVTLTLSREAAALTLSGQARWSPAVAWSFDVQGDHLDPSVLYPDWPADLAVNATASGTTDTADIALQQVHGTLLGQPMTASGQLTITPEGLGLIDLDARSADSTVEVSGQWAKERRLDATVDIVDLGHFLPTAEGAVAGQLAVEARQARVDLQGTALAWDGYAARSLDLAGTVPLDEGVPADVVADFTALSAPGMVIENGQLTVQGPLRELRVITALSSEQFGVARARVTADLSAAPRRFLIESLESENPTYGHWELVDPTMIRLGGEQVQMDKACLASPERGELCTSFAMEPGRIGFAEVELHQVSAGLFELPLSVLAGEPMRLDGQLEGAARIETEGMQPTEVTGALSSPRLALQLVERSQDPLVITNLAANVSGGQESLQAEAEARLESGQLRADITLIEPFAPPRSFQDSTIRLHVPALASLDSLVPSVTGLRGQLDAQLGIDGPATQPELTGQMTVEGLSFLSAEYGTRVEDGRLVARFSPDGQFEVEGRLPSAGGVLTVAGEGALDGMALADLGLVIRGDDVRIADTPDLRLLASPNLRLSTEGERLRVRGRLEVDEAYIELGTGDTRVRPSPDVIVVRGEEDADATDSPLAMPIDVEVELVLGDKVRLVGYGIEAELDGAVTVIERTGERTLGRGEIELTGTYRIYGQELVIDNGRLIFAGTPVEDPGLDIDAYRQVQSVRAGVHVTGRASSPEIALYSDPEMEDSNILAYLLTGRPLDQTTTGESDYVSDAALALAMRQGTEITTAIGSRLGFEQFGFTVREDLGGAAFAIGRYLAPDLYLRYTLGLLSPVDLLELEYRISEKWSLETRIGVETRVGINYRLERGAGSEDREER